MRRVEPIIGRVSDTAWQVNLNQSCGDRALNTDRYTNSVEFEGGGRKLKPVRASLCGGSHEVSG